MHDDTKLFRLIYASLPNVAFGAPEEMAKELLHISSINNAREGITGLLVADDSFFLQLLEGDRQPVTDTFLRISRDHRHATIALIAAGDHGARLFPNWAMSVLGPSENRARLFARHRKSAAFEPHKLTASEATRFFVDVSASARTFDAPADRSVVYVD